MLRAVSIPCRLPRAEADALNRASGEVYSHVVVTQQGFYKAVKTARTNRKRGKVQNARFPHKRKFYRPDGLEGRTKKKSPDRWHLCPMCGLSLDRDTNAAVNIKALGQYSTLLAGYSENIFKLRLVSA